MLENEEIGVLDLLIISVQALVIAGKMAYRLYRLDAPSDNLNLAVMITERALTLS